MPWVQAVKVERRATGARLARRALEELAVRVVAADRRAMAGAAALEVSLEAEAVPVGETANRAQ